MGFNTGVERCRALTLMDRRSLARPLLPPFLFAADPLRRYLFFLSARIKRRVRQVTLSRCSVLTSFAVAALDTERRCNSCARSSGKYAAATETGYRFAFVERALSTSFVLPKKKNENENSFSSQVHRCIRESMHRELLTGRARRIYGYRWVARRRWP